MSDEYKYSVDDFDEDTGQSRDDSNTSDTLWRIVAKETNILPRLTILFWWLVFAFIIPHAEPLIYHLSLTGFVLVFIETTVKVGYTYLKVKRYPDNPRKGLDEPLSRVAEGIYTHTSLFTLFGIGVITVTISLISILWP